MGRPLITSMVLVPFFYWTILSTADTAKTEIFPKYFSCDIVIIHLFFVPRLLLLMARLLNERRPGARCWEFLTIALAHRCRLMLDWMKLTIAFSSKCSGRLEFTFYKTSRNSLNLVKSWHLDFFQFTSNFVPCYLVPPTVGIFSRVFKV